MGSIAFGGFTGALVGGMFTMVNADEMRGKTAATIIAATTIAGAFGFLLWGYATQGQDFYGYRQ